MPNNCKHCSTPRPLQYMQFHCSNCSSRKFHAHAHFLSAVRHFVFKNKFYTRKIRKVKDDFNVQNGYTCWISGYKCGILHKGSDWTVWWNFRSVFCMKSEGNILNIFFFLFLNSVHLPDFIYNLIGDMVLCSVLYEYQAVIRFQPRKSTDFTNVVHCALYCKHCSCLTSH